MYGLFLMTLIYMKYAFVNNSLVAILSVIPYIL